LLDGGRIIEPFLLELDADAHLDGVRQTHLQLKCVALANDGVLVELQAIGPAGNLPRRLVPRPRILALELVHSRLALEVLQLELADEGFRRGWRYGAPRGDQDQCCGASDSRMVVQGVTQEVISQPMVALAGYSCNRRPRSKAAETRD